MSNIQNETHLRFLHCSDIHLDTAYTGLSEEKSDERRRELRVSFMHMMQFVRDRGVNVVLMSGDVFDTKYATNTTAEVLIREMRNCPGTVFIISPGKHDAYRDNPIYTSGRLPANCYVFSEDTLSRFDFEEYNVTVYGWAFKDREMRNNPLLGKKVDDVSRINIVCGYADLDADVESTCCPISTADLKKFGADYYALGSHHEASGFDKLGDSICCYCGSLECTGFEEPGLGGANLIVVNYKSGELSIDVKRLSFGHLRFITETIDITGVNSNNEIINRMSRLISDKKYGVDTALCIELVGYVEPRFIVPRTFESDAFGLYLFSVVDKTLPLYGTEPLKRDMTVSGEMYRHLLPLLQSEDEEERLTAARAFRVGLAMLEGREIDL